MDDFACEFPLLVAGFQLGAVGTGVRKSGKVENGREPEGDRVNVSVFWQLSGEFW
jgi:hypothetical protein